MQEHSVCWPTLSFWYVMSAGMAPWGSKPSADVPYGKIPPSASVGGFPEEDNSLVAWSQGMGRA